MALDQALSDALRQATREAGQSDAVASRLIAWLERSSDEEMSTESIRQFYFQVLDELKLKGVDDED